jgi:hypothetical protein
MFAGCEVVSAAGPGGDWRGRIPYPRTEMTDLARAEDEDPKNNRSLAIAMSQTLPGSVF